MVKSIWDIAEEEVVEPTIWDKADTRNRYDNFIDNILGGEVKPDVLLGRPVETDFDRELVAKMGSALYYTGVYGIPPEESFDLVAELGALHSGEKMPAATLWGRVKKSYQSGKAQTQAADLGYQAWTQLLRDPDAYEKSVAQIEKLMGKISPDYWQEERSFVERMLQESANVTPFALEAAKVAPVSAGIGGVVGGLGAMAAGGTAGALLPDEIVTVPAGIVTGMKWGATLGAAKRVAELETGLQLISLMRMKDKYGNKIDPKIAFAVSGGVGLINGAIEVAEIATLASTLGVGTKVFENAAQRATTKLLAEGTLNQIVAKYVLKYGYTLSAETAQELVQEGIAITGDYLAVEINNLMEGTEFKPATGKEIAARLLETAEKSAMAFAPVVGVGVGGGAFMQALTGQKKETGKTEAAKTPGLAPEQKIGEGVVGTMKDLADQINESNAPERQRLENIRQIADKALAEADDNILMQAITKAQEAPGVAQEARTTPEAEQTGGAAVPITPPPPISAAPSTPTRLGGQVEATPAAGAVEKKADTIESLDTIIRDVLRSRNIADDTLTFYPVRRIIEDVYGVHKGMPDIISVERVEDAFKNDEKTKALLAEKLFRYLAEKEGADAEALMGPMSALTEKGKRKALEDTALLAEQIHEIVKAEIQATKPAEGAVEKKAAEQTPAPTKGKWNPPPNLTREQFDDWIHTKGSPSGRAKSLSTEDQWAYYQEQQAPAPERKAEFGSVSPTTNGKFVAYDTIRKERLYVKGKGITIRQFDSEAEARKALDKLYQEKYAKPEGKDTGKLPGGRQAGGTILFSAEEWAALIRSVNRHIASGLKTLEEVTAKMVAKFGEAIRPYVKQAWDEIHKTVAAPPEKAAKTEPRTKKTARARRIEKRLKTDFGEAASYEGMNMGAQAGRADKMVTEDPDRVWRILNGLEDPPVGMRKGSLFVAMEIATEGDSNAQRELAVGRASHVFTELGQEIKSLDRPIGTSSVRAMKEVASVREKSYTKRTGEKSSKKAKTQTVKEIKAEVKKQGKWSKLEEFIKNLEC